MAQIIIALVDDQYPCVFIATFTEAKPSKQSFCCYVRTESTLLATIAV